jgi:short-subunit dehydrogenase
MFYESVGNLMERLPSKGHTRAVKTLIFGATGGIGQAVARALRAAGEEVVLSGRNPSKLRELAQELGAVWIPADVGHELEVAHLCQEVGAIDTLIYAAGTVLSSAVTDSNAVALEQMWNANYWGALWALKHALPHLAADGKAYLIGAYPELVRIKGLSQYAASKAALAALVEVAALERKNTLTLVLPPATKTPLWNLLGGKVPRGALEPEAVARAIVQDALSSAWVAELRL